MHKYLARKHAHRYGHFEVEKLVFQLACVLSWYIYIHTNASSLTMYVCKIGLSTCARFVMIYIYIYIYIYILYIHTLTQTQNLRVSNLRCRYEKLAYRIACVLLSELPRIIFLWETPALFSSCRDVNSRANERFNSLVGALFYLHVFVYICMYICMWALQ